MTVVRAAFSLCILCVASFVPSNVVAEGVKRSYSANYDLVLKVGDNGLVHIQSGGKVRLDRAIPMDAGHHKVEVSISKVTATSYTAEIAVFERFDDSWIQLVPERPTFRGNFGAPVEYSWKTKEIQLDLALVIGEIQQ